jgi:hypothetical protein
MSKDQTISLIESMWKPYAHIGMPQSTYWTTLNRIKQGLCSPATEAKFFNRFGYHKVKEAEYEINEFPPK